MKGLVITLVYQIDIGVIFDSGLICSYALAHSLSRTLQRLLEALHRHGLHGHFT